MNLDDREKLERWIDAYVDNRLSTEQRGRFEEMLRSSAQLREAVELQHAIDQSLRRQFTPPAQSPVPLTASTSVGSSNGSPSHKNASRPPAISRGVMGFAMAAALAVAAIGGWYVWMTSNADIEQGPTVRRYTLAEAYREAEKIDFRAEWLCKDDKEFAQTFYWNLGQALAMAPPPANVVPTGISYVALARSKSPRSVEVIARVGNKGVIVFVDKICKNAGPDEVGPGLYAHARQLDKLCLIEVSPFEQPVMLDLLSERDIPDDWKTAPTYGNSNRTRDTRTSEPATTAPSKWKPPAQP